jgi:hypothetical protein
VALSLAPRDCLLIRTEQAQLLTRARHQ